MVWGPDVEGASLLYTINLAVTVLSLTGSLIMTYYCFRLQPSKSIFLKLITSIALSDGFYSLANLISSFESEEMNVMCYIEGFIRQCSFTLTLFFTTCLAILCSKTSNLSKSFDQENFFRKSVIIGIILSLAFVLS